MGKIGKTYGIYTVIGDTGRVAKDGHKWLRVRCDVCGKEFDMMSNSLRKHTVPKSCPHTNDFMKAISDNKLRERFRLMYRRCYNEEKDHSFKHYGGKNVKICDEWLSDPSKFEKWALANGYDPKLSIDRRDENGDYCPENCSWISMSRNAKFKSTTTIFDVNGDIDSGRGWARRLGLGVNDINDMRRNFGHDFTVRYISDVNDGFHPLVPKVKHSKSKKKKAK